MMTATQRYALSFTSGALLTQEALIAAPIYLRERDWATTRAVIKDENILQTRVAESSSRLLGALIPRLQVLTEAELQIVADGTSTERGHLMWAAACRRYALIGEFAEEVLRERFLTLAGTVTYEEFDSFYRGKSVWHDELDAITDTSYKKIRQVVFKMMVDAGLLTKQSLIEPTSLSAGVAGCLRRRTPSEIRFFPTKAA